uniref:Uncharacterized protein n=1 Tax=Anopheles coluzzii TaxID=1518534 RepID=A0A6E8W2X5_ANOCL
KIGQKKPGKRQRLGNTSNPNEAFAIYIGSQTYRGLFGGHKTVRNHISVRVASQQAHKQNVLSSVHP